jgi:hypothetical protein
MFKLQFETINDQFGETADEKAQGVVLIMDSVWNAISDGKMNGVIRDENGNRIGEWSLTNEDAS